MHRIQWYAAWQRRSPHECYLLLAAFGWLGLMRLLVLTLPLPWLLCLRLGSVQTAELACVAHQQIALMRCAIQAGPVAIRRISADFAQLAVAQTWGEKAKIV